MKYRPLSPSGDMIAATPCLTDHEACIASLRSRLHLFQGDWWETPAAGYPVPLIPNPDVRSGTSLQALANTFSAYVSATPGVLSVSDVTYHLTGCTCTFTCTVTTQWSRATPISTAISL